MISYDELVAAQAPHATRRVKYGPGALQFGDLRLPSDVALNTDARAIVVLIHGGCWESEYDLGHVGHAAAALAAAGYVVWVPEYRRLGDEGGGWPGTFDDVAAAVDFVRTLAKSESLIDVSRVILAGHSAGGQLALWAASRHRDADASALAAAGVVSLAGITDLAAYGAAAGGCNASVTPLLGGGPSTVPDRYRARSPIELVPIGVPLALVHGQGDPIVPIAMLSEFVARAKAAGDQVNVTVITGAGHFDLLAPQSSAWMSVMAAFEGISPPR